MTTILDVISQIRSRNKWLAEDSEVSDRTLYKIAQDSAALLVKQEFNKGRLLTSDNVFQVLECEDLQSVSSTECDIPPGFCSKVRRSDITLQGLGESEIGYSIMGVFNIINSKEIFPTTIREFINLKNLRIPPIDDFYLIKRGKVYILNEDIEKVNIYVFATENLTTKDSCISMYDREFKLPTYLHKTLFDVIDQSLINLHKFDVDPNDDNNEEQGQTGWKR